MLNGIWDKTARREQVEKSHCICSCRELPSHQGITADQPSMRLCDRVKADSQLTNKIYDIHCDHGRSLRLAVHIKIANAQIIYLFIMNFSSYPIIYKAPLTEQTIRKLFRCDSWSRLCKSCALSINAMCILIVVPCKPQIRSAKLFSVKLLKQKVNLATLSPFNSGDHIYLL